jgi:2-(1,2-epoxy-1,2-dihydrophenyl)acetyl-CoA isomerase
VSEPGVRISVNAGVLEICISRPERKNALDVATTGLIIDALESAATDDSLRVVVIGGEGENFCSGADWVSANSSGTDERPRTGSLQRRVPLQAHRLIELLVEVQLPVVCVVRGWAAGLGCQLALAADFTVATTGATFWEPFLERGFTPDSGATWLLPRLVGLARARELLLLGRKLSGREAAEWGLIYRAVEEDTLDTEVAALVGQLASAATVAVGLAKVALNRGLHAGLREAMTAEANALELSSRTKDFREGLAAFREARKPNFEGR